MSSTAVVPLLVGCTGRQAPGEDGGGGTTGKQSTTVELTDGAFEPKRASIGVGGTVTWKNTTDTAHKVTSHRYQSDAKQWEFPTSPLEAGAEAQKTFDEEGLYEYYSITGGGQYAMCGAISVGNAPEITSLC